MTSRSKRGGRGQRFCDDSTKALVIKRVTVGGGGSKFVRNCVMSFMDDPLFEKKLKAVLSWMQDGQLTTTTMLGGDKSVTSCWAAWHTHTLSLSLAHNHTPTKSHTHTHTEAQVLYIHTHTHTHIHTIHNTHTHTHSNTLFYTHTLTHTHTHTHTHICSQTHSFTLTHTHTTHTHKYMKREKEILLKGQRLSEEGMCRSKTICLKEAKILSCVSLTDWRRKRKEIKFKKKLELLLNRLFHTKAIIQPTINLSHKSALQ